MTRFILTIILFLSVIGCRTDIFPETGVCSEGTGLTLNPDHPKADQIQGLIDSYIQQGVPGANVLISDDDGIWIGSGGYASLENSIEMQVCHINKLGSITKMMMGTVLWQLIQDGELNIDDPIGTHIPDVASRITNGDQITVGMLVNHSSGIYDIARDQGFNLQVLNDFARTWTAEEILFHIEGKEATNEPGEKLSYSNANTLLSSLIIESITGRPHSEVLQSRIFSPLGMNQTIYYGFETPFPSENLAQGYLDFNNDGGSIQNISRLNPGDPNGYTGVYSTVSDLYRFLNALLREKTLTTPENLDFILDNMITAESGAWRSSYGAIHDEFRDVLPDSLHAYGHAGGDIGYSANLSYFPHNNTIFAGTFNYGTNLPSDLGEIVSEFRRELALVMAE